MYSHERGPEVRYSTNINIISQKSKVKRTDTKRNATFEVIRSDQIQQAVKSQDLKT